MFTTKRLYFAIMTNFIKILTSNSYEMHYFKAQHYYFIEKKTVSMLNCLKIMKKIIKKNPKSTLQPFLRVETIGIK